MEPWLAGLRALHEESFKFDWAAHLQQLNHRYDLDNEGGFRTVAPSLPPGWFNGDVEAIRKRGWTLVISINPGASPLPAEWYRDNASSLAALWEHWRTYNRDIARTQSDFFPRLADVASRILQQPLAPQGITDYATTKMVFIEVCPYATSAWPPPCGLNGVRWTDKEESDFFDRDPGVATASRVAELLINGAEPALILVNGKPATKHFQRVHGSVLAWGRIDYPSVSKPGKRLWHLEGSFGGTPTVGFPMLRKARTHNSQAEITQLVDSGRHHLASLTTMA